MFFLLEFFLVFEIFAPRGGGFVMVREGSELVDGAGAVGEPTDVWIRC